MIKLTEEALEARRVYYREWRKKNPDKVREINSRYWQHRIEKKQGAAHQMLLQPEETDTHR